MKIYTKILATALPMVLLSLFVGAGVTYCLSRSALTDLAERWLETRLSEAMKAVVENEKFLRHYGITNIASGVKKAQYDAGFTLGAIEIGEQGYVFVVDSEGHVVAHPDPASIGKDVGDTLWFREICQGRRKRITYSWSGTKNLAMYEHFAPWNWYVIATDTYREIYGAFNKTGIYVATVAFFVSFVLAFLMVFVARKLTAPLRLLVSGAQSVGHGALETRIPVQSKDEFGHLSTVFNKMAAQLQESLGALKHSEEHFRSLIENASDMVTLLDEEGRIVYMSPSSERILGSRPSDLVKSPLAAVLHPEDLEIFGLFFHSILQKTAVTEAGEFRMMRADAGWRTVETVGRNLLSDPAVQGVVINSRDITARKMVEEALQESEKRLHLLTSQLLTTQERESRRISSELHDEVGQSLMALKFRVTLLENGLVETQSELKEQCEETLRYIDQVVENIRRICRDLTPSLLEDLGLTAAVGWLVEDFVKRYRIGADVDIDELDDLFAQETQIVIYRIFQEALTNIGKHSGATRIRVGAKKGVDTVLLLVSDNGRGFDVDEFISCETRNRGLGLAAMHERARILNAILHITSSNNGGTSIRLHVPVDREPSDGIVSDPAV